MKNFSNIFEYSKYFKQLVEFERNAEQQQHLREIQNYSPQKRQRVGRALLGLKPSYQGRGLGNTVLIKFGREESFGDHEFSVGDLVIATPCKKPHGEEQNGTVVEISKRSITLAYISSAPNYLLRKKQAIRLDLFTNDISFSRMQKALTKVKSNPHFKRILLGKPFISNSDTQPFEKISSSKFFNSHLNDLQQKAINDSLYYQDIFFLHGPPGTGKTTTLVESILQHQKLGKKVLVCADSNVAVDNLVEKLVQYTSSIVRLGNAVKVNKEVVSQSLDYKLEQVQHFKDAQSLYKQIDEIRKKQQEATFPSRDLKRGLSDAQIKRYARTRRTTRGIPIAVMKKMGAWLTHQERINECQHKARILEKLAIEEILNETSIVCSTNINAGSPMLEEYLNTSKTQFDVCFVDEATQSVEPSILVPALLTPKLILAGDHLQLPPTVLSQKAKGLNYSLFERLIELYDYSHYTQLSVQYRMNEKIMAFPNKTFYNNSLKAHESVASHRINISSNKISSNPVEFISLTNSSGNEEQLQESTSYFNKVEAQKVEDIVSNFVDSGISKNSIGIISPYTAQVQYLKKFSTLEDVEIKSIDGFQGREKDIIIVSFVRSNSQGNLGFLQDQRRLNVAITRARKKLILIGDTKTLSHSPLYKKMITNYS